MNWRIKEVSDILRGYFIENGYDSLQNRKKIAAVCGDLLAHYENEKRILTMLFREGLGEYFAGISTSNEADFTLTITRINKFAVSLGLDKDTQKNVIAVIHNIFFTPSTSNDSETINEIYVRVRDEEKAWSNRFKKRAEIAEKADIDKYICEDIEELWIPSFYKEECLPNLSLFTHLKRLYIGYPITWEQCKKINMSHIEEMRLTLVDESEIRINAPILENITVYVQDNHYDELSPIEQRIMAKKIMYFENTPNLKAIKLLYIGGYDISSIGGLPKVETVNIRETENVDITWLSQCPNLQELRLCIKLSDVRILPEMKKLKVLDLSHNEIKSIDNLRLFPSLQTMELASNKIERLEKVDGIAHVRHLDIRNNPIINFDTVRNLNIDELVINEADLSVLNFTRDVQMDFRMAYKRTMFEKKNMENYSPIIKRRIENQTEQQRFEVHANNYLQDRFYGYNPEHSRDITYSTEVKKSFLEFVSKKYSFFVIKDEYKRQIQNEKLGIQHFYEQKPGRLIFIGKSIFIINVEVMEGRYNPEIKFLGTRSYNVDAKKIKKQIKEKCEFIDVAKQNIKITVFDLYAAGNASELDFGIVVALQLLKHKCPLSSDTFIAGGFNRKGEIASNELSEKMKKLACDNGAKNIVMFTRKKRNENTYQECKMFYYPDLDNLQEKISII